MYASQLYTILAHRPCRREKHACLGAFAPPIGTVPVQPNTALNFPLSGDFLFYHKGFYLNWISLYR